MQPFWRTEPLSEPELELIEVLGEAHNQSSFRSNPSSAAVQCAAQGSGELCRAIAAALMTLGGTHGPVEETYGLLNSEDTLERVGQYLKFNRKIPGWGTSFGNGHGDPLWKPVDDVLIHEFTERHDQLKKVTGMLHDNGKMVLPNPSAYTAMTAIIVGMPSKLSPYLLITSRMSAWAAIFLNELKGA